MKVCACIDVRYIDREIEIKIEMVDIGINKCILNIPYCKKNEKKKNTEDVIFDQIQISSNSSKF